MKKLALTTVCALAMAGAAFAQGTISWSTLAANAITAQTNTAVGTWFGGTGTGGVTGPTASAGAGAPVYYYQLLYSSYAGSQASITSLNQLLGWQDAGLTATNSSSATAGRLLAVNPNPAATVPWPGGTTESIVLVGWSANLGTTWGGLTGVSNLLATTGTSGSYPADSFFGISSTGYISPNTVPAAGAVVFAPTATANGLPIYSLNTQLYALPVVPEPTTIALAGLGGLSLLLFRRQRK